MFVCKLCGTEPKLKTSLQIYGNNNSPYKFYWVCPVCGALVACKPGTFIPMGELADRETRVLRILAHKTFDSIWKNHYMTRDQTYCWLSQNLKLSFKLCHFSLMSKENLIKSIECCNNYLQERNNNNEKT